MFSVGMSACILWDSYTERPLKGWDFVDDPGGREGRGLSLAFTDPRWCHITTMPKSEELHTHFHVRLSIREMFQFNGGASVHTLNYAYSVVNVL
jgi:hypothetical protein